MRYHVLNCTVDCKGLCAALVSSLNATMNDRASHLYIFFKGCTVSRPSPARVRIAVVAQAGDAGGCVGKNAQ